MESGPRDPLDGLWLAVLLIAVPLVVWGIWSDHIVTGVFHLKLAELELLAALGDETVATAELAGALHGALTAPEKITWDAFWFALDAVGVNLRGPLAVALLGLGLWLLAGHPAGRFRRRFDLWRLAEALRETWPFALHALRRGQLALPLDHPVWGMARSGPAFLRHNDLVEPTVAGGWTLREVAAEDALAAQLGAPWVAKPLPLHVHALAGVFALRIASFMVVADAEADRLKQRTFDQLRDLALAAANHRAGGYLPPMAAYRRVIEVTAPFLEASTIQPLVAQHAYTATVLLRLLAEARRGGVLPPALFSWLKGVDRPLWYALTSLGRRVPFVEALGAMAHYQAERAVGAALYAPTVGAALEGLRRELGHFPPDPAILH